MPELPEVETVRRGIAPHLRGRTIAKATVREGRLRRPVGSLRQIEGKTALRARRRGKYILVDFDDGALIVHLGMSGTLYFSEKPPQPPHEHVGLLLKADARRGARFLIYRDPRRFGCFFWCAGDPDSHPLLREIGPEPLSRQFSGGILHAALVGRQSAIKPALMDSRIVAGVGNIYASESLHLAGVRPQTLAGRLSPQRADAVADAVRRTLRSAIDAGGSTIRDYARPQGDPGMFQMQWRVYGREKLSCSCGGTIKRIVQAGRATYYCPRCQT